MVKFSYRARNAKGEVVFGEVEAAERREAAKIISHLKLIPLDVKDASQASAFKLPTAAQLGRKISDFFNQVPQEELMFFFQQMQMIYSTGIPLMRGLDMIQSQVEHKKLKEMVLQITASVASGRSLSEAMEKYPELFDGVTLNLVRAGETSGQLEEMIDRIARLLQQRIEQRAKISMATFYPKLVVGMIGIVFCVVVYVIVPKFEGFFSQFGAQLPLPTRILVGTSHFMNDYWWLVFGLLTLGVYGIKKAIVTPGGRALWDKILFRLPVFGPIFLQNDMVSFCNIFEMLIRSGIPITTALRTVKGAVVNSHIQEQIESARIQVEAGKSLHEGLDGGKYVPKTLVHLVGIGEEAGSLEKTMNRLGAFYRTQLDYKLNNLTKAIEPILLFVVFGMVLLLALGVFMPLWKMNSLIRR